MESRYLGQYALKTINKIATGLQNVGKDVEADGS